MTQFHTMPKLPKGRKLPQGRKQFSGSLTRLGRGALGLAMASAVLAVPAIAQADVTLGVLIPASGKGAAYGQQQKAAIEMFMAKYADLGKAGKLKLQIYDTRGANTEAINLTRRLIGSDDVVAIVGPQFSGECEVAFPVAVRGKTPIISPMSAKPGVAAANRPWAFRFALTTENDYRPMLAEWVKRQKTPIKSVVILMDNKDAVSSFDGKKIFPMLLKERGIKVLDTITFTTGDIDYSAQVTRAKSLKPDGIVISALYNEAANTVRELRKQGMNQPIVVGVGVNNPRFIELGGKATEGVMAASDFYGANPKPAVATWAAAFEKKTGKQPTNAAGLIYDTLYLMRQCIMKTGVTGKDITADKAKIRDCWTNMKDEPAPLTGATSINKEGDATRVPTILVVKGGRFVPIQ